MDYKQHRFHDCFYYFILWCFLSKTSSHDKNVTKIFHLEEELLQLRHGDHVLPKHYSILGFYEGIKFKSLDPPCKHYYKDSYKCTMVAKFVFDLSH